MSQLLAFVSASDGAASPDPQAVEQASACLDRFTAAFNAMDPAGMDAELHFPHTLMSGAQTLVWAQPGQHPSDFFDTLLATGWTQTRYESRVPVLVASDKVHFVVTYTRRGARGETLSRHVNLWIVVRHLDTWGIALRSY